MKRILTGTSESSRIKFIKTDNKSDFIKKIKKILNLRKIKYSKLKK
jgi:hypothetical protein